MDDTDLFYTLAEQFLIQFNNIKPFLIEKDQQYVHNWSLHILEAFEQGLFDIPDNIRQKLPWESMPCENIDDWKTIVPLIKSNLNANTYDLTSNVYRWHRFLFAKYNYKDSFKGLSSEIITAGHLNKVTKSDITCELAPDDKQLQTNRVDLVMRYPSYTVSIQVKSGNIILSSDQSGNPIDRKIRIGSPDWIKHDPPTIHKYHRISVVDQYRSRLVVVDYNLFRSLVKQDENGLCVLMSDLSEKLNYRNMTNCVYNFS